MSKLITPIPRSVLEKAFEYAICLHQRECHHTGYAGKDGAEFAGQNFPTDELKSYINAIESIKQATTIEIVEDIQKPELTDDSQSTDQTS